MAGSGCGWLIASAGATPTVNEESSAAHAGTAPGGSLKKNRMRRHNYSWVISTRWRAQSYLVKSDDYKNTRGRHCRTRKWFCQSEATTHMQGGITIFESQMGKLSIEGNFYDMLWAN